MNYYKNETKYDPPIKFKLANIFTIIMNLKAFSLDEIFNDFENLLKIKNKSAKIKITDPEIDDVYFLKGLF